MFAWLTNQTKKKYFFNKSKDSLIEELKFMGITNNNILLAIKKVPRELFVQKYFTKQVYDNIPLPIDCGQTISQPYVAAYMLSCLNLKKTDKVLEIGTGTGYQTALLSYLCKEVCTIEIFGKLLNQAKKNIAKLKIKNISFKLGNGIEGWKNKALFDAIIISASSKIIPTKLIENLKNEGILIMPKKYPSGDQKLVLVQKNKKTYSEKELLSVKFVALLNTNV